MKMFKSRMMKVNKRMLTNPKKNQNNLRQIKIKIRIKKLRTLKMIKMVKMERIRRE